MKVSNLKKRYWWTWKKILVEEKDTPKGCVSLRESMWRFCFNYKCVKPKRKLRGKRK